MDGNPNYNEGYYSPASGFCGENPQLWDGCVIALDPGLGNTGATIWDHSGYHNHGTLTGTLATHWVTDSCGMCLDFPDSGDLINIPYSETFASKTYSWSIWIRSSETGTNLGLVSRWQNSGGTYSWVVTWEAGGGIYWYHNGLSTVAGSTVVVHDGSWHHLCGTYDKATTKLYLDGVEKHSVANTGDYNPTTQPLVLGTYATTQDWDGKIRGFAFWNRGLSAAEVLALATDPSVMYRLRIQRFAAETVTVGVLAGSSAIAFSASATVVGMGVISGSSAVSFAATGDAVGIGVIAGEASVTFASSATPTGTGVISASSSITLAASATIEAVGVITGTGTVTFAAAGSISAPVEIEGTAGISFTGSGEITGVGVMAASSSITLSSAGEISGVGVMAGTAGITFTQSAEITGLGTLEGTAAVVLGGSGELIGIGELAAESTITLGASATIVGVGVVEGAATITFAASGSATDYGITFLLCVGAGKWASPEFYVVGAATAEFCLNIDPATAEYLVENAMSCECECDGGSLETLLANTKNTFPVTLTNKATGAAVNGKTLAWTLKTKDGVTSLGSGTATDSGAGGIYNITISQAIALQMTAGLKYRLTLTIAADGFEQRFEPTAKFN